MTETALSKELIADTAPMRLLLRVEPRRLSALIVGPESVDPAVIFHSEELADGSVRALENAVYDNPLLLGDFAAIDIVFASADFFLLPAGAAPLLDELASAMLPDFDGPRTILSDSIGPDPAIGYAIGSDRLNFLSRTFACARFHHSAAAVAAHIASLPHPAGFHALIDSPASATLCAFDADGRLLYLNRPQTFCANDCAYYILAANSGLPLTLAALDPELRASVADTITKVKPSTRLLPPDLSPALLELRRRAPQAAFDLLFLARQ